MRIVNYFGHPLVVCLTFILLIVPTPHSVASQTDDFNRQYLEYTDALDAGVAEIELGLMTERLATLGTKKFGELHANTINLTISAANHYRNAGESANALRLYDSALELMSKRGIDDPIEYANLISEILSSVPSVAGFDDQIRLSNQLFNILRKHFNEESPTPQNLVTSLDLFHQLVTYGSLNHRSRHVRKLGKSLVELAEANLPDTSNALISGYFNYAKLAQATGKEGIAVEYYTKVINALESALDFDHPFALGAHARLVSIFEAQGNSDAATQHCIAIGKMTPWSEHTDPVPLYRVNPEFPVSLLRSSKEGVAVIEFDISELGFVQNVRVFESSDIEFDDTSFEAITRWRYAPKFEDGVAVVAENQRVTFEFSVVTGDENHLENL